MTRLLITGATSGIGKALAIAAAQQGYSVVACGRNEAVLNELCAHPLITSLCFDVTNKSDTQSALATADCDVVVLNAGTCEYVDTDSIEPEMFERVFATNFFGIVNCVAALLPNLKNGSQLVIVDSMARLLPFTRSQAYGASKAALHYFTKSMDVDLKAKGIIVQSVSPGFVETPLTDKNDFEMPMKISVEQAAKAILKGIQQKRTSIYFPMRFGLILRTLNLLPDALKTWLSSRMI